MTIWLPLFWSTGSRVRGPDSATCSGLMHGLWTIMPQKAWPSSSLELGRGFPTLDPRLASMSSSFTPAAIYWILILQCPKGQSEIWYQISGYSKVISGKKLGHNMAEVLQKKHRSSCQIIGFISCRDGLWTAGLCSAVHSWEENTICYLGSIIYSFTSSEFSCWQICRNRGCLISFSYYPAYSSWVDGACVFIWTRKPAWWVKF